ncbi:unnamed protein product [Pieris brassicae]|uniref:Glucose-methanol-choline oxidoreductase N-terminal domain-containing protein n=1 Tax=Pieris brassicae TaxID=7116 RepID=A0A9P0TVP4_PIEBR|nr:unnamed protein product [Pieris brassicae]
MWTPPDITEVCASTHGNLTQCTSIGITYYLTLLAQLFGRSVDNTNSKGDNPFIYPTINDGLEQRTHEESKNFKRNEYDYIIVGAGSAGCVLAHRLSEIKHWKILLLEAGNEEPNITSVPSAALALATTNVDWAYYTQPNKTTCLAQKGQVCLWSRGKTMGGSSSINYMTYVLPYFEKSINLRDQYATGSHGVGGPLNVERFSYNDEPSDFVVKAFQERGIPFADLGLETKVGVNINLATAKDGEVIISAGSINSPKILKCSGIGPKDELESLKIPVIANLMQRRTIKLSKRQTDKQPEKKRGPLSSIVITNLVAFLNSNGSKTAPPNIPPPPKKAGATFIKTPIDGCKQYKWGTYDYFACLYTHYTTTIYHPVGTCKMGPPWDKDAVLDPRFKVYKVKKLRVVDASAMRNIVRGNTNAPTIMMAEKASDIIKEDKILKCNL